VTVTLYQKPAPDELGPDTLPWRVVPEIAGGGKFLDLAPHTLDVLDYYFGPIRLTQGMASNQGKLYRAEDVVTGTFVFESGVHGVGVWCFTAFRDYDMNEIIGTRGKIAFSSFGVEPVVLTTFDGVTEFPIPNPPHVHQPLIQTIVDELNGLGRCPSTGITGVRTTWVMDEILRGYRSRMRAA
jgi:predicted dehydrogenase